MFLCHKEVCSQYPRKPPDNLRRLRAPPSFTLTKKGHLEIMWGADTADRGHLTDRNGDKYSSG